jgi:hypothetical protein
LDVEIQLWRPFLDVAEDKVLDGIEADRAQLKGLLHCGVQVVDVERLQQTQNLHILAASCLDHPRFHQAAQGRELRWQVSFRQGRRLIQRVDLLLDQRKVMHRIEHHVLAVVSRRGWRAMTSPPQPITTTST